MPPVLRAAEWVLPGHPDKLCDAIADALVQEAGRRERRALVGVEVAVHRASVFVTGRIACHDAESIDVGDVVRNVFASAGYGGDWPPAPEQLDVHVDLCVGPLDEEEAEFRRVSDDQAIATGYACDLPGTNYLPVEQWLAARLALGLQKVRGVPDLCLGPDGKVLALVEEEGDSIHLACASVSLQQALGGPPVALHRAVNEAIRDELTAASQAIPGFVPALADDIVVNGAGDFAVGGPQGDNGLSGKKLVVDAYGPRVPIGGGALSGKDLYKADRAGAILARRLAKAIVLIGAACECYATLAFIPGSDRARIVRLDDETGQALDSERWERLLDLTLAGVGDRFTNAADLVRIARYGHFLDPLLPWERISFDTSDG
jgi:S-adenosylmethionine synthetase